MIEPSDLQNHGVQPSELTNRQQAVLELCQRYFETAGEPCSVRYLARRLDLHPKTVQDHLNALLRKGRIAASTIPVK